MTSYDCVGNERLWNIIEPWNGSSYDSSDSEFLIGFDN
jgi:hypothetical protein